ncbi:hypothetical protein KCU67_g8007, partial [Aureobasidium melanogenum]
MSRNCPPCNACTANPSWMQTIRSILCISIALTTVILVMSIVFGTLSFLLGTLFSFLDVNYGQQFNDYLVEMLELPMEDDEDEGKETKSQNHSTPPRKRSSPRPFGFTPMVLNLICVVLELQQEDLVPTWPSLGKYCSLVCKRGGKGLAEGTIVLILLRPAWWAYRRSARKFVSRNFIEGQTEL